MNLKMDLEKVQADCRWKESKLVQSIRTWKENIKYKTKTSGKTWKYGKTLQEMLVQLTRQWYRWNKDSSQYKTQSHWMTSTRKGKDNIARLSTKWCIHRDKLQKEFAWILEKNLQHGAEEWRGLAMRSPTLVEHQYLLTYLLHGAESFLRC